MFVNATGSYIPSARIHNDYFLNVNGLTNEWIFQRTGILTRSKASEDEDIDVMCIEAVRDAQKNLSYNIEEVDLIIFASYSPSDTVATTAHVIQREFKMEKAKAFFISSACSSAINAMEIIKAFFETGRATKALLVSADRNTTYINEDDPKAGHLWGDAAAAIFFSKDRITKNEAEVIDVTSKGLGHIGKGPGGVTLKPKNDGIRMPDGKDVFIHACNYIAKGTRDILEKNNYSLDNLSFFIGHQANMRILSHVAKELSLPEEKVLSNIKELGNTGSVSSILVYVQNHVNFNSEDLICISVFGGGYSSGAALIKY